MPHAAGDPSSAACGQRQCRHFLFQQDLSSMGKLRRVPAVSNVVQAGL